LLADAAYLSLKPAEWAGMWLMRRALDDFDELAAGLYCETGTARADETRMN
jgi:hypothetical protein